MYGLRRTVAPTSEPVTTDEAKLHLRLSLDATDEDAVVDRCIAAARQWFEDRTGRALINQTWKYTIDNWYASESVRRPGFIYLPRAPLSSVTSVYYTATDGSSTLWDSANYTVDTESEPGRLALAYSKSWPVTREVVNAISITYVAGYGATAASVPDGVKAALLLTIADLFENRETFTTGTIRTPLTEDRFITPWMVGDSYFDFAGVS